MGDPQTENNYITEVLPQELEFWVPHEAPQPEGLELGVGDFRAFGFEGQWGLSVGLHRTGGNRDSTLRRCTQGFMCTGTEGKAVSPQKPGPDLRADLRGTPGEVGVGCGPIQGQGHWWWRPLGNTPQCELSWRSPFWHQDLGPPNSLQTPVLVCLRPNNQQGGNTAPPISRQAALSRLEPTATSRHATWHGTVHQKDKTQLHSPVGRHESLPRGSLHKLPDQPHPPEGRHQKQEELQSCSLQNGAHKPRKLENNEMAEIYVPDEGTR